MTNWKCDSLGNLISYISKGIPPKYEENKSDETIYVLNQKCNRNYAISYDSARLHNNAIKPVNRDKVLKPNDVLINSTGMGTAGRVAQIFDVPETTTFDGHMILIRNNELIDPIYFGYSIKAHQSEIESLAEGSTGQTEINRARLCNEIKITFPEDKAEQKRIGEFLLNIDNKIAINTRINDNLAA